MQTESRYLQEKPLSVQHHRPKNVDRNQPVSSGISGRVTHPSGVGRPRGQFQHPTVCDNCRGTGRVWGAYKGEWLACGRCHGVGDDPRITELLARVAALEGRAA